MKWIKLVVVLIASALISCTEKKNPSFTQDQLVLIPQPKSVTLNSGSFKVDAQTQFVIAHDSLEVITGILNDLFEKSAGFKLDIANSGDENTIQLVQNTAIAEEAYKLDVTNEKVVVEANSKLGFVYGLETIRQLLPAAIESSSKVLDLELYIPNVHIDDAPQYPYRGSHLDVSRHFFGKEYIKKHLDRMAFLKLNTFHFHLVDDQGWRIEIKKYPKLTEVGAFRVDQENKHWNARTQNDPDAEATYGGFYTQEDIKEIVAYASEKGIRVIPEIEMPAHVMSAIAAYPWLSCKEESIAVPSGGVWPITDIYCAGKESTFEFLEDVLTEVMALFPGEYIHAGGDEATKTNWETCPHCQRRMREEGLANTSELQSYFMKRMERFLSKHNKTLIGWDEILEGGLPEKATVMSWRGFEGGWEATAAGHDVIMTPVSHMYFDYYQGNPDNEPVAFNAFLPLEKVYEFRPAVDSMSVEQKKHVLGGQANLWSEYIATESHSEYMLFPRLFALSETLWSPEEKLDWTNFSVRVRKMMQRFDVMGINYATSAFAVQPESEIDLETGKITISLQSEFPDTQIRYALRDSELNADSEVYSNPIAFDSTTSVKAAVFKDGKIMGAEMQKYFDFHQAVAKPVTYKFEYNASYASTGATALVDVLRGSKYFKDGRWQGWINNPAVITIDLEGAKELREVTVGSLEEQGTGIYFPQHIKVEVSRDGKTFEDVAQMERAFEPNPGAKIENFKMKFESRKNVQFVRVTIEPLAETPKGGGAWLFLDEILVK
ncbi:glycoside hydrolase family 20 protein [Leeuwenhoekiella marinoflava]|uniref:beta-N-acetylhexosaminidase n=2 Tax=Leeuwenhoekiella marinoflava TaxID=988 RepID=A0A4Q0P4B1_9FLAO|nr:family 20 glycosylhydrolase [Leeuwenhoekiella marinoflava]RXG21414.1 hexosaminidase [Leeuwenhoekiella marinoflava]SHG04245.1 hexosaminidase [Leeuwenhoekiella marinoflava DSM 3653]